LTLRFANIEGRAALVDGDGRWIDAERLIVRSTRDETSRKE
jgi:hypothetical protein